MPEDKKSNCNKCFYHEIFEAKIMKRTIDFCHSKGHQIYMIDSITDCLDWRVHKGKKK